MIQRKESKRHAKSLKLLEMCATKLMGRATLKIIPTFFLAALVCGGCVTAPVNPVADVQQRADAASAELERPAPKVPSTARATHSEGNGLFKKLDKDASPLAKTTLQPVDIVKENQDVTVGSTDPSGCTWVDSKASIAFGENDTKHQARAQAVAEARIKAMHRLLGVNLRHQFIDFQQEGLRGQASLTESLLRVTQLGRVLKENVLSARPEDVGTCISCRFTARIQTCIVPLREHSDPGFRVNVELGQTTYRHGDEATVKISTTRDAYLYVYDIDMQSNASLIFPNQYVDNNLLKAGEPFQFPTGEMRRRGVRLLAQAIKGSDLSAEMIRVIASKTRLPAALTDPSGSTVIPRDAHVVTEASDGGNFLDLMRRLNEAELEWVEDAQTFTIYAR